MSDDRPHVLVDGYELRASGHRGIGTYLRHLLSGLAHEPDLRTSVLASPSETLPAGIARVPVRRPGPARWQDRQHALRLPAELRRSTASVVHTPGRTVPRSVDRPWVHTLHDLTPLVFDHPTFAGERVMWERQGDRLRTATTVITPSKATARVAIERLNVDRDRIVVIPHGIDPALKRRSGVERASDPPHLLWVSSWGPHKGLDQAVAVMDELADRGQPHHLRVVGWNDRWMRKQVDATVRAARRPERVHVDGWVADIGASYRSASALLVTSRSEGFCLPAAEAMACGTPVVAYDNTAITELVEGAGLLVPDGDVDAMVGALHDLLDDQDLAAATEANGTARAATLSWSSSVSAHVSVFAAAVHAR